jgi:hypothetical protein
MEVRWAGHVEGTVAGMVGNFVDISTWHIRLIKE